MNMFGPPNIDKLVEKHDAKGLIKALGNKDSYVRYKAVSAMGDLKDPVFVEPLVQYAFSDMENTKYALRALGRIKDRRAVPPLLAFLGAASKKKDSHGNIEERFVVIAQEVIDALAEIGDPLAVREMIDALDSGYVSLSETGSKALLKLGNQAVLPLAGAFAQSRFSERIVKTLGEIGTPSALEQLERIVDSDDEDVRQIAAKYLAKHNWTPKGERAYILAAIGRGDFDATVAKGQSALPLLASVFKEEIEAPKKYRESNWGMCARIASAMARLGVWNKDLEDALMTALLCDKKSSRLDAIGSILKVGCRMEPRLTADLKSAATFMVVCREIKEWFWKETPEWALMQTPENRWFIEMLKGMYRNPEGPMESAGEKTLQNVGLHGYSEESKEARAILIMLGDFSLLNNLAEELFSYASDTPYDAGHLLYAATKVDAELRSELITRVCHRIVNDRTTRAALFLLKEWCDVRCLDAFVHVVQKSGDPDLGEMAAARDGILELLSKYGSKIDSRYAEILMNLPDKIGSVFMQSDYSWDHGHTDKEEISMEKVRLKAREVWAGRVAEK